MRDEKRKVNQWECISDADGLKLSVLEVVPQGTPKGFCQIVHGMCEHKERYLPFMEMMAKAGYVCGIHDHRGHGKSVKDTKDLGYMYEAGPDAVLKDLLTVVTAEKERWPDLPYFMLGHSMGSLAARVFAKRFDFFLDGLILSGSPSKNPLLPAGKGIAWLEGKVRGADHHSRLLEALSFGAYAAKFPEEKHRASAWICSDEEVTREYSSSPLCSFTFTDDGYRTLFWMMGETYKVKGWICTNPDLPILFLGGREDPCIGGPGKFAEAIRTMRMAGYRNVKGKLYPGMRHEILNEIEKERVYRDILAWLGKQGL